MSALARSCCLYRVQPGKNRKQKEKYKVSMRSRIDIIVKGILNKERWALSKALTLAESTEAGKQEDFRHVMSKLLLREKDGWQRVVCDGGLRIGVSGPPGAGKSSLIDLLGQKLVEKSESEKASVAVLAVDPSSVKSGGAILGDKTRMFHLSSLDGAFFRPSPSGKGLGGVNRATYNSVLLCTAAGYETVLVETVGVGQSETAVSKLVDCMVLVLPPVGGDELQLIKRGITEFADIIVVNKADGATKNAAQKTAYSIRSTLHLCKPQKKTWLPRVVMCSARTGLGIEALETELSEFKNTMLASGQLENERVSKVSEIILEATEAELMDILHQRTDIQQSIKHTYLPRVIMGEQSISSAAREILRTCIAPIFSK